MSGKSYVCLAVNKAVKNVAIKHICLAGMARY
jgi:hypothetical protein